MVFKYSALSEQRLASVHPDLQKVFRKVLEKWDHTIIEGVRSAHRQEQLFREKKTQTMNSKHLTGHAVDVAPWPIDWKNTKRFYAFGGYVLATADSLGIPLRWGGDWDSDKDLDDQKFFDLVHYELR